MRGTVLPGTCLSTAHVNYGAFFTPHCGSVHEYIPTPFSDGKTEDQRCLHNSPKVPQLVSIRVEVQTQGLGPRTHTPNQPATFVIYKKAILSVFFLRFRKFPK